LFHRAPSIAFASSVHQSPTALKRETIQRYLNEKVFETLGYFDGMNFAVRARAKSLFSVALMDKTCPPSTVFAAYNHYAGDKDICVWKYNDHEGGEAFQVREKIKFLTTVWE